MTCSTCSQIHPIECFPFRDGKRILRRKQCKFCINRRRVKKARRRRQKLAAKKERQDYIREALKTGCVDCHVKDIRVLEFDHVRGDKVMGVAKMARWGYSLKAIKEEIAKCEVRCRNCHAIETYTRAGWSFAA